MASAFVCDEPGKAPAPRQCATCSSVITRAPGARGALPSYCGKPCKRPASPPKTIERHCLDCAAPIMVVKSAPTSRCAPCGRAYGNANAQAKRTANAMARNARTCMQCGASFQRMRNTSGNYCSRPCEGQARSAETKRISIERAQARADAKAQARAELKAQEALAAQHKPRACQCCALSFVPSHGAKLFCSKACSTKTARRAAKAKGIGKRDRSRARYYGVPYEPVSRAKVFERDRWRCQLCGVKTPKTKRGTLEPDAPELDHILPMSKGGEHSYRNTHCACRACNIRKGSKPLGQARLF